MKVEGVGVGASGGDDTLGALRLGINDFAADVP